MTDGPGKPKKRRDPLLDAALALESGHLTHQDLVALNTPEQVAQGYRQDTDLGTLAAAGLGAARGASFGLGDLAQKLLLNAQEKGAVATTAGEHPYATTAGTVAGAALPFLLAPGLTGAQIGRGAGIGIGAAQGAGLADGGIENRALGAALGAGGAFAAPYLLKGAGAVASKTPILGAILRRAQGIQPGFTAALKAAPEGTPEEIAVAKRLGLSLDQVRGKVGAGAVRAQQLPIQGTVSASAPVSQEPLLPALRAAADVRETVPAFVRNPTPGGPAEGLLPYYPRGGAAEQALAPRPQVSPPMGNPGLPLAQLKLLLHMPPEQFEAAATMFPPEVMQQLRALRGGLLQPALP